MDGKEKILATGIALVLYLLVASIVGQIIITNYFGHCLNLYPPPPHNINEELRAQQLDTCLTEGKANVTYNALLQSISLVVVGLIAVILAMFVVKAHSVSTGLTGGGILLILNGTGMYYIFSQTQLEKTILLAVAFVVLVAVGYFKFAKKK
jgi:hypothetical protein